MSRRAIVAVRYRLNLFGSVCSTAVFTRAFRFQKSHSSSYRARQNRRYEERNTDNYNKYVINEISTQQVICHRQRKQRIRRCRAKCPHHTDSHL